MKTNESANLAPVAERRPVTIRPSWQSLPGVSPGTWDYVRNHSIANDYEEFLQGDPLTVLDWQIVSHCLPPVSPETRRCKVIEFGCGDGRTLVRLGQRGYGAVGVDLSLPMLMAMKKKFDTQPNMGQMEAKVTSIQANLVQLDGIRSDTVDHGICLFSTLGMIQGEVHRQQFLKHARRIIRPGGYFIVHAHQLWSQLLHRGGLKWMAGHLIDVARGKMGLGDRFSNYRGIRNMFIHSFRRGELERLLTKTGFEIQSWHCVTDSALKTAATQDRDGSEISLPGQAKVLSTVGWIVVCR